MRAIDSDLRAVLIVGIFPNDCQRIREPLHLDLQVQLSELVVPETLENRLKPVFFNHHHIFARLYQVIPFFGPVIQNIDRISGQLIEFNPLIRITII